MDTENRFTLKYRDMLPCLNDCKKKTPFDIHYIYHLAWAVRVLAKNNPKVHIDISSSLYFCSLISAFIPMNFYDYRPAKLNLSNLSIQHIDLTNLFFEDCSIKSLSCMHVVEHIGLGRYGDQIDPKGDIKAINELKRVLSHNGNLLFVVPIGQKAKILFNSHQIYTFNQILSYFKDLTLVQYSLITDNPLLNDFIENADPEISNQCIYGCGCFHFFKE